jgi:lipopolysaccharide cholinephosphotransferase
MKTKKDIQLELLQEVDDICSKYDLKYILVGTNALNAFLNHTIKNGPIKVAVAMTQGDIDRFCKIIETQYEDNRYVEGIFNSPNYPDIHVSYGNKNTTDFHMVNLNKNIHHGIEILIYPIIRSVNNDGSKIIAYTSNLSKEKKIRQKLNRRIENPKFKNKKIAINLLNGFYSLVGCHKRYYNKLKNNIFIDKWEDIQNYSKVRIINSNVNTDSLKGVNKYEVDGVYLSLPKDADLFFSNIFGKNFRNKEIKAKSQGVRVIIDTEVGYEEIINDIEDLMIESKSTYEEIALESATVDGERKSINNIWNLLQMTDKQLVYKEFFENNIGRLSALNLNDEEQLNQAYIEITPVVSTLKKYSKYGMTFSIDSKSDKLIEDVLLAKGNKKLVKKLKNISQKQYYVE